MWSLLKSLGLIPSRLPDLKKLGGVARHALLALGAACAIACGGFVNVGAAYTPVEVSTPSSGVEKVYNADTVDSMLNEKADQKNTFTKEQTYSKGQVNYLINKLKEGDVATNKANITALAGKTAGLSPDGKSLTDMKSVETGELKVTGQISNGADVTTTLTDIKASMDKADANGDAIGELKATTAEISHVAGGGTNISDVMIKAGNIIGTGNSAITGLTNVETGSIKTDSINGKNLEGHMVATDKDVEKAVKAETDAREAADNALEVKINEEKKARQDKDKELNGRIGRVADDGNYIKNSNTKNVSQNLTLLDAQVKTNEDAIAAEATERKNKDTELEKKITKNSEDIATLDGKVTTDINDLKAEDTELENKIKEEAKSREDADIALGGRIDTEKSEREAADEAINDKIGTIDNIQTEYVKEGQTISQNLTKLDKELKDTNDRTGGITRNTEDTQTTIEKKVTVNNSGDVGGVKGLSAETITTTGNASIGGALTAGDAELKNTAVGGTLGVTGATTLDGTLTAKGEATFEKAVTVQKDLTVDGKLNVGEISMKNNTHEPTGKTHESSTSISADGISNQAKVTDEIGNSTESKFTHNEKGTFNYARDQKITGEWKGSTSNVTADGVSNEMTDFDGNTHTYYQTATETKEQLVNGDKSNFEKKTAKGNTISIKDKDADGKDKSLTNKQTVDGEKTSVTNKDSSSTINQRADKISNNVTSADGTTKSSTEVKADGITNTSDGTIKNDAKDIVNNASGNISNKSQTMDTTVKGKATESYGSLDTTVNGNETHIVKGTKTETVEGKVTENYKAGQKTNVTGDQDITVSGTQTTTATDINRNASSGMIDTVKNASGSNTETKVAGKTTTDVKLASGEEGLYIRGATESRDYLLNGTLKNSETKTAEATSSEITDGTNKASTRQDAKNLAGSVTNGNETGVSGIHANADGSVSIDSAVAGGGMSSVINQKKDSITSAVGDGTNSTVILQDKDNVTIASSKGMVGIVGKDIVNNAQATITNTAGTSITNQVNNSRVTTDAKGTTFENNTAAVSDGGTTTTKINGNLINTGRVEANELGVSDVDGDNTANLTVQAGEDGGVKASASKGTTKGSLDVTAEEVGSTVKDDASGNSSTFKQRIDKIMGNVKTDAGESEVTQKGDDITSVVGKGEATNSRVTQKKGSIEAAVTDGTNINDSYDTANASAKVLTDGTNTSTQQQTASLITTGVKDGAGNENASAATATSSANTIKNGSKANTVISTADGTRFINSDAMTPVTGASGEGDARNTTIKGNTITTGKVTMDYAEVMKDLGVTGNTTTGSLEVKGESKLTGKVTMENDAIVGHDLTVKGITTTKTLKVTENAEIDGNATIKGDVTARSYKVGGNTYIDADGIHANNQKITDVADGSISEGSKDAVNGGQLYGMKTDLEHKVDKVGANAAAMANLHPMEFDPDSKWNIAAAMGNYGSETATAIGAFYRPNEDVMVNFSTAFGTGENMVGGGVSVRLGKGSNKLSREESNALKDQVNDLTARMDALLSVLNPNMSKDFPDVPENHWAYEAVSRLAGNDIVQGYPDGEFHGERTMTRYEMAEIIYNALSRGAEAERELVEEFKPELQAMAASEKATAERAEG